MPMTLLVGGARSGKSRLAVQRAAATGRPVVFVATGRASDTEMAERIRRHQAERPAGWSTIEEPLDLDAAVASVPPETVAILDCLSLWVANLMGEEHPEGAIEAAAQRVARACADSPTRWFVVTNEVGMGLVPMSPVGRDYRDRLGRVNAIFSRHADLAQLVVAGRTLTLDPPEGFS